MLEANEELALSPNNDWWTRPLLNRDWKIRLRAQDFAQSPLLITGRYGAGKIAVWASSVEGVGDTPSARSLWKSVPCMARPTPAHRRWISSQLPGSGHAS